MRLDEGERAWSMTLRAGGPEYVPLRTFRDDDLLDPGSDPLIALLGALSDLNEGERVVARLMLRSLGPNWSRAPSRKGPQATRSGAERLHLLQPGRPSPVPGQRDGVPVAGGPCPPFRGYLWVRAGETWKAALLGRGHRRSPDGRGMGVVAHQGSGGPASTTHS